MKNKNGYAVYEMIILSLCLAVVFGIIITKVSFAYQEASNSEVIASEEENSLLVAANVYVKAHEDKFKKDGENYLFGKDLIEAGYLFEMEDTDYGKTKLKVTYNESKQKYQVEIVL